MPSQPLAHVQDNVQLATILLELHARAATTSGDEQQTASAIACLSALNARVQEREQTSPELPSVRLMQRLQLSLAEMRLIWITCAIAVDHDARQLAKAISKLDDPTMMVLSRIGSGAELGAGLSKFGANGRLHRLAIVERSDGGNADVHESRRTWAISARILTWLHGDTSLDPAMDGVLQIPEKLRVIEDLAIGGDAVREVREAMATKRAVVVTSGMPGLGRRTLLVAVANEAGLDVLEIKAAKLAKELPVLRVQLRQIARECKLLERVPLIVGIDALASEAIELMGKELVAQLDGMVLATSGIDRPALRWDRPTIAIELVQPTSGQRATLWHVALGHGTIEDGEHLAGQYPLAPALIHQAAAAANVRLGSRPELLGSDIYAGIRTVIDDKLGHFAKRVTVTQRWEDLVLSRDQVSAVMELIARIQERRTVYEQWDFAAKVGKGLGVGALFSGPPGTGKTMVASLIARDLGLELYQVDLAKIVSKWVGETEKQLAALFDAAEAGHAILLFDEADSLFGKRTDVRSSNDRYANLETNYLLQRLESYTGICLLTSNHESNIDPAFQRRLSLYLQFNLPDVDERERLWKAMLPRAAPVEDGVDFAGLAGRYAMSGGYIRNATLRAAFLAAHEKSSITYRHLDCAARLEYEGMGKIAAW